MPQTVLYALWIAWFVLWRLGIGRSSPVVKRPKLSREVPYRILTLLGAASVIASASEPLNPRLVDLGARAGFGWMLVAVAALGFAFAWWARIHLGRLWSARVTRKVDHHVVDTGPYGIVRHPIYTGILIALLATALLRGTAAALVGLGLLIFGFYVKARLEESFLRSELGEHAYDAYADHVPMLIPFAPALRAPSQATG